MNKKSLWKLILILAIPCIIGFMPAPAGLSELAWVLFGIYLAAIVGLVIKPFPEPVVLLIAVAASMVVVGNLSDGAFKTTAVLSGYSSGTTWLVFSACGRHCVTDHQQRGGGFGVRTGKKSASCRTLPDDVHLHGHQNHQLYVLYRNGGEHSGAENDQRHSAPAN